MSGFNETDQEGNECDFRDDLLIKDLDYVDREMHSVAMKNAKAYHFRGKLQDVIKEANAFMHQCLYEVALPKLGLKVVQGMDPKMADRLLKTNHIKIENRPDKYEDDDIWRNGLYLFKRGELVYFISAPLMVKNSPIEMNQNPHCIVSTNVVV